MKRLPAAEPKHAIILVHGLQGKAEDMDYLKKILIEAAEDRKEPVVTYNTNVNYNRTKDGVAAGAERIAADIRQFVATHPALETISLVGFSLGKRKRQKKKKRRKNHRDLPR